jgi:hypothetical protein
LCQLFAGKVQTVSKPIAKIVNGLFAGSSFLVQVATASKCSQPLSGSSLVLAS